MNRELFIKEFEKTGDAIDKDWIKEVLNRSIDAFIDDGNPRGHHNLIIVMEELAELSQQVSKELRGKGDRVHLLEELADVALCIGYVQEICGIRDEELQKAVNVKVKRLKDILSKDRKFI